MSEHQESLKQVVARIEAAFVKIKSYGEKVDQFRISAGKQLVELKVRIEAGEAGKGIKLALATMLQSPASGRSRLSLVGAGAACGSGRRRRRTRSLVMTSGSK